MAELRGHGLSGLKRTDIEIPNEYRSLIEARFNELKEHVNFEYASEVDLNYNCLSWALSQKNVLFENEKWGTWPWRDIPDDTADGWARFLERLGYARCSTATFEPDVEKIAIYENSEKELHACRQASYGVWKSQNADVDSNNAQITEVWTISPRTINEARMGFTYQGNFFADQTLGQGFPQQLGWQFAKADSLPSVQFNGSYPYAWIQPNSNAVYKEQVFDPSDVVTMIRGKHVLHFGGEFLMYDDNSTTWGNINAGTLQFDGSYTRTWSLDGNGIAHPTPNTGLDYADFLLGYADSWGAKVSPEYGARLKSPQVFIRAQRGDALQCIAGPSRYFSALGSGPRRRSRPDPNRGTA